MQHTEYLGTQNIEVSAEDRRRSKDCPRLLNGLGAIEGHCKKCDEWLRHCVEPEYKIYDANGHPIVNWLF
jgi:hypothetical protein